MLRFSTIGFLLFITLEQIQLFSSNLGYMGDKRDATMAGLAWPTHDRTSPNPRTTGSADSDMTDDIGHETFAPLGPATLPSDPPPPSTTPIPPSSAASYNHYHDYTHYGPWTPSTTPFWQMPSPAYPRDRTVHTIYFKIWDPDSPARSLYVEEINQQGIVRQFDPEHFFHKLTGDHVQANQMSDYWRSHYGLPLKHGGTPYHPTWASFDFFDDTFDYPYSSKAPCDPPLRCSSSGTTDFPRSSLCGHPSRHHHG